MRAQRSRDPRITLSIYTRVLADAERDAVRAWKASYRTRMGSNRTPSEPRPETPGLKGYSDQMWRRRIEKRAALTVGSGNSQVARMRNLTARDRSNRGDLDRRHGSGLTVECHELNFQGLAVSVNVNHRSDVADLQALVGHRRGQYNSIVFSNHTEDSLLAGIRSHEPRRITARVDNPYRSDPPPTTLLSVPRQPPIDNKFNAVHRSGRFHDIAAVRNRPEGCHQQLGIFDREA